MQKIVVLGLFIVASIRGVRADYFDLPKDVAASFTVYVPVGNGKLEKRQIGGTLSEAMPTHPTTYACVVAEQALTLLFQSAPASFPKGTRLRAAARVEKGSKVIEISLSREFWQRGFWNNKTKLSSAIYAIVNTAVAYHRQPDFALESVLFLKDGAPVRNVANVDLRKPLRPRDEMVATNDGDAPEKEAYALWLLPPEERDTHWAEAFIGGRPSLRSGERSALRWLSRLLLQKPNAKLYRVEWRAINDGIWWALLMNYKPSKKGDGSLGVQYAVSSVNIPPPYLRDMDRTEWNGIDDSEIHAVARKGGTLKAFARTMPAISKKKIRHENFDSCSFAARQFRLLTFCPSKTAKCALYVERAKN